MTWADELLTEATAQNKVIMVSPNAHDRLVRTQARVGPYEIRDNENADGITELDNKNGIN